MSNWPADYVGRRRGANTSPLGHTEKVTKKKYKPKKRVTSSVGKNLHRHKGGRGGNKYAWRDSDLESNKGDGGETESEAGSNQTVEVPDSSIPASQESQESGRETEVETQGSARETTDGEA